MNTPHSDTDTPGEEIKISEIMDEHRVRISNYLIHHWGSNQVVSRGRVHQADLLPGFFSLFHNQIIAVITYNIDGHECEIVTLNSDIENKGFGTVLIKAVQNKAIKHNCKRLWVITTNDNIPAIRFYQKKGFSLIAIYPKKILESRNLKPSIPEIGLYGIPIQDEIEFEIHL